MNIDEQCHLVVGVLPTLRPVRVYAFSLLLLERMVGVCQGVFAAGLPTKRIPYPIVNEALEDLWGRMYAPAGIERLAVAAESWRPLTAGFVEHAVGASLGFHVAESVRTLAGVALDHEPDLTTVCIFIWDSMTSTLFRVPEHPDYSTSFNALDLEPPLNRALLEEFEAERADIHALRAATPDLQLLRNQARAAGNTFAATVRERLLTP